jgi:4-hydroxybenzoyl-CoA reductase alpha subunit
MGGKAVGRYGGKVGSEVGEVSETGIPPYRHTALPPFSIIGKPLPKIDAAAKCLGRTKFADDIVLPRMLAAKILRSPHPHARIVSIDISRAEALDGVKAVITGRDVPIAFGILPVSQDEHALESEHVRFIGDPVAAVAAIDEDTATQALDLIDVSYQPLEVIGSIADAVAKPEPQLHDYADDGNIHKLVHLEFGPVDETLDRAHLVQEDSFFYEGNTHLPMEQHATVAEYGGNRRLTVWSSSQTPHYVHRALEKVLEIPRSRIRVVAMPNGGGFGGKSDPFAHEIVAAKLAILTGRPVKICLTREEVFYCHRGRHPVMMKVRTGVAEDGTITGMDFESYLDGGAYGSYGVASTYYTGALQTVTYQVPAYRFRGMRAFTNKAPCGPKRGHGTPQPRFAVEVTLDKIAERLDIDPAELRLKQLQPADSLTANWLKIGSMGLGTCIDKVVEGSDWKARFRNLPYGKGLGLACSSYLTGAGLPIYWNAMPHSAVQLKCDRGGGVTVFCGSTDIGQGSDSILAYIVAEVLGVAPMEIAVVTADTDLTPVDLGSYSSRVTLMTGQAAIQAAERVRVTMVGPVATKLDVPAERLVFAGGMVFDAQDPERGVTFAEAVALTETATGAVGSLGSYRPPKSPGRYRGAGVGPSPAYSYSACVAEVDVDPETGIVQVPRVWIGHDIGRSINSSLVMGQVEGGVYMGLGEALMEELAYRPNRNVVHKWPSMLEYKSPTTHEMCDVTTYLIEDPDANGPFGAKEAGQGPLLPVMPAVANAIYDAVGVRIDEVPMSPPKVHRAIKDKAKGKEPRFGPTEMPTVTWPEVTYVPRPSDGGDGKAHPRPESVGKEG